MVLRLACPHCGPRPVEEWIYGEAPDPPTTSPTPTSGTWTAAS